jgi:hypothetical protein
MMAYLCTMRLYSLRPSLHWFNFVVTPGLYGLLLGLLFQQCTITDPLRTEPFESGILVLDSRQQNKPGSVSFIDRKTGLVRFSPPKSGLLTTDIFNNLNDRRLQDTVFSSAEIDGKDILVVPTETSLEVVESSTFRSISLIGGVETGRYVVGASSLKAYVSCWGGKTRSAYIGVIDLTTRRIVDQIQTAAGPEQMAVVGNELFVAHSGGEFGGGKTVSVINTTTNELVTTIQVGDVPTSVVYDAAANLLYVLCSGRRASSTPTGLTTAELVKINPTTRQVVSRIQIGGRPIAGNPTNLTFDPNTQTLYFMWRRNVYKLPASATSIPLDQPLISRSLLTFGFDPVSSTLYGGAATNRSVMPGVVLRYKSTGALIDSIMTEAIPTGFYAK